MRSERLQANKTTNFNDDDFKGNLSPTLHTMIGVYAASKGVIRSLIGT